MTTYKYGERCMKKRRIKIVGIVLLVISIIISVGIYIFENQLFFWDKFVILIENKTDEEPIYITEKFGDQIWTVTRIGEDEETIIKDKTYKINIVDNYSAHLERFDISQFNFYVHYLDPDTLEEIGSSNTIKIPAEYGKTYNVVVEGNHEEGLRLELK